MPHEENSLGLQRLTVALRDHCTDWAIHYACELALLRQWMGDDMINAAHIGSTAIPGIAAKPIIDIMIAVPTLDCADRHRDVLAVAGYEYRPNGDGPERRFFAKGPHSQRTHHLSMTLAGSGFWHWTLIFRDYLIEHVEMANRYDALKRRLAGLYPNDRPSYTEAKSAFVAEVITLAGGAA